MALRDVMDHVVEVQKEITKPTPLGRGRGRGAVAFLSLTVLALCAYSALARPVAIWGPSPQSIPAARQEADVRFAMFLVATRLDAYRAAEGEYPESLSLIDVFGNDLEYASTERSFELRGRVAGRPIVLRSAESRSAFLGSAPAVIRGHAP